MTDKLKQAAQQAIATLYAWAPTAPAVKRMRREAISALDEAMAEPAPQQEAQEPVAWQSRTRPTWGGDNIPWSPWEPCTKGQAEDYWKTPLLHDWAYEARALYTVPQPSPASQGDALESEYQRGYRQGYEQRDAEVRGALV